MFDSSQSHSIYKIDPILNYRLWGSATLGRLLNCNDDKIYGEAFLVSALQGAQTTIEGVPLQRFYRDNPASFGLSCAVFPLRINLIETTAPLSVQSHPNLAQAQALGLNKAIDEAWFILKSSCDSDIVYGHHAQSIEQFRQMAGRHEYGKLLRRQNVHAQEFYYLPGGTIHAIGKGLLVYEVTCNVDITYRLYDFDRIDPKTGSRRTLHEEDVIRSLNFPNEQSHVSTKVKQEESLLIETYFDEREVFTIERLKVEESAVFEQKDFHLMTIVEGNGRIMDREVRSFETYLVPKTIERVSLTGPMTIIATTYKERK